MTCIAGFVEGGRTWIGGDAAGTYSSNGALIGTQEKVFWNNNYLFGCSGSFRMMQILHYSFEPPHVPAACANLDRFMATRWIDALRAAFKRAGYTSYDNGQEEGGTQFLVAYRGRLYCVEQDFNITRTLDNLYAIGLGGPYAAGALYALQPRARHVAPQLRLEQALMIAETCNASVRGPFTIMHT